MFLKIYLRSIIFNMCAKESEVMAKLEFKLIAPNS